MSIIAHEITTMKFEVKFQKLCQKLKLEPLTVLFKKTDLGIILAGCRYCTNDEINL